MAMKKAMYEAELGDDVHGDDPTVNRLEEIAAQKTGMEAALFCPSGTMANTIALKIAAGEGEVVILEKESHIFNFENGNIARINHSLPRIIESKEGEIPLTEIREVLDNPLKEHIPKVRAVALENTHNSHGGTVLSQGYIKRVSSLCKQHDLHLHLDGARVFNAAVALNIDVKDIIQYFDSVMFCLSKGLAAPIGSILTGSNEFIRQARVIRKCLGGGMRQVGILAAAGIIALEQMTGRLHEDHLRAKKLAVALAEIPGTEVNPEEVVTNFVMLKLKAINSINFVNRLKEKKILTLPFSKNTVRILTHKDINDQDIDKAIEGIAEILI
jgi:threonine aldolase